jgi:hypothetical protein
VDLALSLPGGLVLHRVVAVSEVIELEAEPHAAAPLRLMHLPPVALSGDVAVRLRRLWMSNSTATRRCG